MDIVQSFYDKLAGQYDKLFEDWQTATRQQAAILNCLFRSNGFAPPAQVLDCACGIGTQAIGLAALGYQLTATDISSAELAQAEIRAAKNNVTIRFAREDFRTLENTFTEQFDVVIAMDNALPHMLTADALQTAVTSMLGRVAAGGIFVASIRDYDALLQDKPPYSPPYIHKTANGQRIAFQTWRWQGDCYDLTQYMIEDEETLQTDKFVCRYRATRRAELTALLKAGGCSSVEWKFPQETGFYQPIVIGKK